jgi:hypothetical protein
MGHETLYWLRGYLRQRQTAQLRQNVRTQMRFRCTCGAATNCSRVFPVFDGNFAAAFTASRYGWNRFQAARSDRLLTGQEPRTAAPA